MPPVVRMFYIRIIVESDPNHSATIHHGEVGRTNIPAAIEELKGRLPRSASITQLEKAPRPYRLNDVFVVITVPYGWLPAAIIVVANWMAEQ